MILLKDVLTDNVETRNFFKYQKEYFDKLFEQTLTAAEKEALIRQKDTQDSLNQVQQKDERLKALNNLQEFAKTKEQFIKKNGEKAYNDSINRIKEVGQINPGQNTLFNGETGEVNSAEESGVAETISWGLLVLGGAIGLQLGLPAAIAGILRFFGRGGSAVAKGSARFFKWSVGFWKWIGAHITFSPLWNDFVKQYYYPRFRRKFIQDVFMGNLRAAANGTTVNGIRLTQEEIMLANRLLPCMEDVFTKGTVTMARLERMLVEEGAWQIYQSMRKMTTAFIKKNGRLGTTSVKFAELENALVTVFEAVINAERGSAEAYKVFTRDYVEMTIRSLLLDAAEEGAEVNVNVRTRALTNRVFNIEMTAAQTKVNPTNYREVLAARDRNMLAADGWTPYDLERALQIERDVADELAQADARLAGNQQPFLDILNRLEQGQSQRLTRADLDAAFAAQRGGQRGGQSSHPNYDDIAELPWGHPQRKGGDRQAAFVNGLSSTEKNIFNDVFMNWERYANNGTRTRYMDELYKKSVFPDIGKWYNTYHRTAGPWKTFGRDKAIKSKAIKQFYQEDKMLWYINNLTY